MRAIGEIMKDLGFNADAPLETQKAFVRHLIAAANGVAQSPPSPTLTAPRNGDPQLSFDPAILGSQTKKTAGQ